MDPSEQYKVAIHEAGHAIMAAACGFKSVRIELGGPDTGHGWAKFEDELPTSAHYHARHALVALAGMLTEKMVTGEPPSLDHTSGDLQKAKLHVAALPGCTLESFVKKAYTYLERDVPLGLVDEIAMAVMMFDGLPAEEFAHYAKRIAPVDLD